MGDVFLKTAIDWCVIAFLVYEIGGVVGRRFRVANNRLYWPFWICLMGLLGLGIYTLGNLF